MVPSAAGPAAIRRSHAPPRTEFGVDLGRANRSKACASFGPPSKGKHGGALEGLRPVVAVREIARPGGVELRLVAGPLPNAAAAARLCAALCRRGLPSDGVRRTTARLALTGTA